MDKKLLRFQNRRLAEKIEVRRRTETDLRNRIEQLENRLTTGKKGNEPLIELNKYIKHKSSS